MTTKNDLGEIIELRADRALLNPDFDHYILANRNNKVRKFKLPDATKFISPSSEQWGFQHAKLFGQVERVVLDLFNSTDSQDLLYVFLDTGSIIQLVYDPSSADFVEHSEAAHLHYPENRLDALPPSLVFPSNSHAVTSNGSGQLIIYETGNRLDATKWISHVSYVVVSEADSNSAGLVPFTDDTDLAGLPFLVVDARLKDDNQMSVLLQGVAERKRPETVEEKVEHPYERSNFSSRLIWLDIQLDSKSVARQREAYYNAHLEMATLNFNATELVTVGPTTPIFTFDSQKPIDADAKAMEVDEAPPEKPLYVWTQDAEEITVTFALAEPISKLDVVYKLNGQNVSVQIKGVTMLEGELEGTVHLDSSTWTFDDKSLQVTLFKARGHFWRELVKGDKRGLYEPDPQLIANTLESLEKFTSDTQGISSKGAPSTFNPQQLEECDSSGEESIFVCFNEGETHRCVQTFDASCSQVLFQTRLHPGGPKTLSTRQENDGIVWSLDEVDLPPNVRIVHKHTLDAFGYVQAGHATKSYSGCAPDGNFAALAHTSHHLFIYLQNVLVPSGELRNRKTSRLHKNINEQIVINTAGVFEQDENPNVIGFAASNNIVYIRTRGYVIACHVKA